MIYNPKISESELEYYERQIIIKDFGIDAQKKLKKFKVLLIGVGGVGSPVATYLTGLGVGELSIIDDDSVSISNLHRQVLFDIDCLGASKAIVAKNRLQKLNPYINITATTQRLTNHNYTKLDIEKYHLIIDTSDNYLTKILSNKISLEYSIPLLSGGVLGLDFQAGIFNISPSSACINCLYPDLDKVEHNNTLGVVGIVAAQAGLILANLAINFLLKKQDYLSSTLYRYNSTSMQLNKFDLSKDVDCNRCQ
ncbi:HesA/MoeB/ThiF family protein [Francisella hispaniensis]|uniref:Molybdopterin biosynthesis protein n=2 Tax=Francisella hispaniensis TaxID=622488 RepID=F4BGC1_9GAMM|nr:HesA/MoeB/ThiF family protein [Francisella hispaniensis]AEE26515.1 molybdopterin biosynthesis protein [Francisella hispaniensis]APD50390.1 thiamine biosynthesis protein ThiF [Francisella hispaniensis FSC454]KYW82592.1 thiamine biosynthesis protein ThiF [Francisella hispaniensis FSC454]